MTKAESQQQVKALTERTEEDDDDVQDDASDCEESMICFATMNATVEHKHIVEALSDHNDDEPNEECNRYGSNPGFAIDLRTGYGFRKAPGSKEAIDSVKKKTCIA